MATATVGQPKAPETVRDRKDPATTIQLFKSTKSKLDELNIELTDGVGSYDEVVNALIDKLAGRGEVEDDLGAELTERIEALEKVVQLLCADPKNGYVFLADSDTVERGVSGKAGQVVSGGFLESDRVLPGAYVQAPSGVLLSEHGKNIPAPLLELVKREEKKRQDAAATLAKKGKG